MNKILKRVLIIILGLSSFRFIISNCNNSNKPLKIQWIENLKGDFDFKNQWSYTEGIYRNRHGQLDCDGLCPEGIKSMKDEQGKIYPDSLTRFYQLVDTTHQFHSILSEAECYEWAGTDFIKAKQTNKNEIVCYTQTNAATHSSLILEISNDFCAPRIELRSISEPDPKIYYCKGGYIKIDSNLYKQNILKAEFSFDFKNTDEVEKRMFWKGKIYTSIEK